MGTYSVTFTGDLFTLTTIVDSPLERGEQYAKMTAIVLLESEYGWDLEAVSNEISVTLEATH